MSLRADRREWNDLAQADAMWAVHSAPERRGAWSAEDFYATGEDEVRAVMAALQEHGLSPQPGRALDFGCGLGRLTRALGGHFGEVVGVDASQSMVAQARELNADVANCTFMLNERGDLAFLPSESFDFVLSLITLQHVSSRAAIRAYIREFARVTAPGGVIVFQPPTSVGWQIRLHPLRLLNRALRALPVAPRWALRRGHGPQHAAREPARARGATDSRRLRRARRGRGARPAHGDPGGAEHVVCGSARGRTKTRGSLNRSCRFRRSPFVS